MIQIDYQNFISFFNQDEWDISYLTGLDMIEVLNQPIKFNTNLIEYYHANGFDFNDKTIFLVVVKKNYDFDYTHVKNFFDICSNKCPELQFQQIECNLKYAAVKAGLGQYAKNSLFWHPRFQFETHLAVYQIFNEIINLPVQKISNFNLLNLCENCNDCIKSCPVSAIHYDNNKTWIELNSCDNFCHFGNDKHIPSIKWSYIHLDKELEKLSYQEVYDIKNFTDWDKLLNSYNLNFNIQNTYMHFPICRECTSQKKCSRYNSKYPYDWNNYWMLPRTEKLQFQGD